MKAINGAPGFTGDDGSLSARLQTKNMTVATNAAADDFNVAGVFHLFNIGRQLTAGLTNKYS